MGVTKNEEKLLIIPSLDGGTQSQTTEFLPQKSEIKFGKNIDITYRLGGIAKALGYSKKGNSIASALAVLGAGKLSTSGGSDKLVAFAGTDAYVYNSGTGNWDAQSQSFTASQKYETENFLDLLFEVNGLTDAPRSYSGSAWSTSTNVTDMPKSKFIKQLNGRVYLFNINIPIGGNFASRVSYADLPKNNAIVWDFESGSDLAQTASSKVVTSAGSLFKTRGIKSGDKFVIATGTNAGEYSVDTVDSETQITLVETLTNAQTAKDFWVGGNWFDVERNNSDVGMGLGANFNRLLCFKRHSVHKFQKTTDSATDNLLPIKGAPGTTSSRSIVDTPGFTYWWSDTGLWRTDGVSGQLMSTAMQEVVDGIAAGSLDDIVGWFENDRVIKMFIGDVSNSVTGLIIDKCVFCYDTLSNTYWVESLSDTISAAVEWVEGTARKRNFLFSNAGEIFKTQDGNSFDGDPIYEEVETHPYFAISPEYSVNYTRIKLFGESLKSVEVLGWKRIYYDKGLKDEDFRSVDIAYQTEHEIEIRTKEGENRCAGFVLKLADSTANLRPIVNRITAMWTGGELR